MVRVRVREPAGSGAPGSGPLTPVAVESGPVAPQGVASHLPSRTRSPISLGTLSPVAAVPGPHVGFDRVLLLSEGVWGAA